MCKKRTRTKCPWMTPEIRQLSIMVQEMIEINHEIDSKFYNEKCKALTNLFNDKVTMARKTYNNERLTRTSNVNKECWRIINESNGNKDKTTIRNTYANDGTLVRNLPTKCEIFASHFASGAVITDPTGGRATGLRYCHQQSFYLQPTTPTEISEAIRRICGKNSWGIDNIPGFLIQKVSNIIAGPLSQLINKSFTEGIYPTVLKESRVLPVYKKKRRYY